jgi:hypothetical protein
MPRKSKAALQIADHASRIARLPVPAHLPKHLRAIWFSVTSALPADWFSAEQGALLERYCFHVARSRQLEALLARANPLKNATLFCRIARAASAETRTVTGLARSMRLTQQSRMRAETARTKSKQGAPLSGAAAIHALKHLGEFDE